MGAIHGRGYYDRIGLGEACFFDAEGATILRKQLRRAQLLAFFSRLPPCLVGLEACATAHYWARELRALGHELRLMPAQYVKAYIKRNKHDAADAEAICEAVQRPTMRFVPVKTADQQAAVLLHRGRERLVRQRTGLVNALRGHLAEFGVIAPQGLRNVADRVAGVHVYSPQEGAETIPRGGVVFLSSTSPCAPLRKSQVKSWFLVRPVPRAACVKWERKGIKVPEWRRESRNKSRNPFAARSRHAGRCLILNF